MPRCPDCDELIKSDDINIKEGVALCPGCGKLSRLSELSDGERSVDDIVRQTPAGCSVAPYGNGAIATASLRSMTGFVASLLIGFFWNGVISVFVVLVIASLYAKFIGPPPEWMPRPNMNDKPMDLGMTLFLCLFLTPFIAVGMGLMASALLCLIGKVQVVIDEDASYVATGFLFLKWTQRFDPTLVRSVKIVSTSWQSNGQPCKIIEIQADRTVKFGSMLASERMEWLRAMLAELLLQSSGHHGNSDLPILSWLPRKS